jgi:hypothetical protein
MKAILSLFLIVFMVGCAGKEGPMGPQGEQGEQGARGPQGNPAPTSEVDALKRRLAAAEAQLDLIFGDQEPQPLKLGETQLRFINGFGQSYFGDELRGEIENYGNFDAVNVKMYLRLRSGSGSAFAEGWWNIGTIRSGQAVLFNIYTGQDKQKTYSMDYQLIYTEGGETKIGGEGKIDVITD